ncbi:MAG TPA: hypothetical protein DG048_25685 [Pseudoalteromonas sp.]|nr:hypothetical protein [Pseudoalteromonas sp.]|tara:strand:+ start:391 stop:972 length:582 start_codon:yes stop_codon:yes gene_type:complete
MYAIVKDGAITATGNIKQLFPNTSFAGGTANTDFKTAEGVMDIVQGEQKDRQYYFVTESDIALVDGVPTQQYTNTAKRLNDEDAKDKDGNQLYVQVWDADKEEMVDSSEKLVNQGLKTPMTAQVKDTANKLLASTDWMVIRKYERDVAIPSATATYRAAVITECARLETAITNASDVDALAEVMQGQNWPKED